MQIDFKCHPELAPILPRPVAAKLMLPEWFKRMPMKADDPVLEESLPTVKQCPPVVDAMTAGFMIPLPCDVTYRDKRFEWDWREFPIDVPSVRALPMSAPLAHHHPTQATGSPLEGDGRLLIKFINFWTIRVPDGYSLLFTHPFNRTDLPFLTLTGVVDCDRYSEHFVHFPAAWTDDAFEGVLPKGTPVVQVVPVERRALHINMSFGVMDGGDQAQAREVLQNLRSHSKHYRRQYRQKK